MEEQSLFESLSNNKLFIKTVLFGAAILTIYFIVHYLTSSDSTANDNRTTNTDSNFRNTLNQQQLITNKNKLKKRVCLVWNSSMSIESLKNLLIKTIALNYDFYIIIRTDSNDIQSSKEKVKEFSDLVNEKLVEEHVSRKIINKLI
jgi:hypothetical protein